MNKRQVRNCRRKRSSAWQRHVSPLTRLAIIFDGSDPSRSGAGWAGTALHTMPPRGARPVRATWDLTNFAGLEDSATAERAPPGAAAGPDTRAVTVVEQRASMSLTAGAKNQTVLSA